MPRIGPRNEKIAHWVKRIRRQRFLKARQTLFSFANEDYDLADALGREEIQDLSAMRSGSFDEDDTKLMKESKMDIVNLSNKERRLESKMTVGPTIFERLRDLQKFDQKERCETVGMPSNGEIPRRDQIAYGCWPATSQFERHVR